MTKNLINELEEFEKNNDYKEIIHTINQIISIKPELKEKLLLKRAIAYKELEAYEKAIKSFKDYEIYCNSQDKYKLFIMIADCYEELQDSEKENEYLLKSFNLKPTTYSTKKNRLELLFKLRLRKMHGVH